MITQGSGDQPKNSVKVCHRADQLIGNHGVTGAQGSVNRGDSGYLRSLLVGPISQCETSLCLCVSLLWLKV